MKQWRLPSTPILEPCLSAYRVVVESRENLILTRIAPGCQQLLSLLRFCVCQSAKSAGIRIVSFDGVTNECIPVRFRFISISTRNFLRGRVEVIRTVNFFIPSMESPVEIGSKTLEILHYLFLSLPHKILFLIFYC